MTRILAADIGTTGTKAVLLDEQGAVIASAGREYPTHTAQGGVAEQDAHDWWAALEDCTRELIAAHAPPDVVALTGQMQDVILLDAMGEPVRPVILYSDTRATNEAESLSKQAEALALPVAPPSPDGLLAKLAWLAAHEPEALSRATCILPGAADAAAVHWGAQPSADTTTASTTGLMPPGERRWLDPAIFGALALRGIPALLPRLMNGGQQVGEVSAEAARRTGLRAGTPIHLGPGDAGATTIGAGSGEPGAAYLYIGTSGWVGVTVAQPPPPETGVFALAHPHPARTIAVAPLLTAGGNLDWIKTALSAPDFPQMIGAALSTDAAGLLYLPYLNGERSPFSDPAARGAFIGLSARHTRADLARAVLEGVGFAYRQVIEALLPQMPAGLVLTGGGARSGGWSQLLCDLFGVPVVIAADAQHVGVRGAWVAAQTARGERDSYALAVEAAARFEPDLTMHAVYTRKYALFTEAYPALKALFGKLAGVRD